MDRTNAFELQHHGRAIRARRSKATFRTAHVQTPSMGIPLRRRRPRNPIRSTPHVASIETQVPSLERDDFRRWRQPILWQLEHGISVAVYRGIYLYALVFETQV